ncbi:PucR family transcriptional regulator [Hoeflea sp. Naph1]|uniref:PucR family transcriptional regulator n=1 Tax=Hoeflea sp. Naph1 TaxID=3388653 RepID=UPI00398FB8B8
MALTVEQVLDLPAMLGSALLAGKNGTNRIVETATVLDAPDAVRWLRGRELVLTSTYPLLQLRHDLDKFVHDLVDHGASGLGLKLNRYMKSVPQEMIDCANALDFPILVVPENAAWVEIITPVMSSFFETRTPRMAQPELPGGRFGQIMLPDISLEQLLAELSKLMSNPIVVISPMDGLSLSAPHKSEADIQAALTLLEEDGWKSECLDPANELHRRSGRGTSVVFSPYERANGMIGNLVVVEKTRQLTGADLEDLVYAKMLISLKIRQNRTDQSVIFERQNEFVLSLTDRSIGSQNVSALTARYAAIGKRLHPRYVCIIIAFQDVDTDHFRALSSALRVHFTKSDGPITGVINNEHVVVMVPEDNDEICRPDALTEQINTQMRKIGAHAAIWSAGVSQITAVNHFYRAYEQAKQALDHGRSANGVGVHLYDETGFYRLFSRSSMQPDVQRFVHEWLGTLIEHDQKHKVNLLETFRTFLDCDTNYRETARTLNIHHNTVRYRIGLVVSMTHKKALQPKLRLHYHLALKLLPLVS